jgi:hypothetical protein
VDGLLEWMAFFFEVVFTGGGSFWEFESDRGPAGCRASFPLISVKRDPPGSVTTRVSIFSNAPRFGTNDAPFGANGSAAGWARDAADRNGEAADGNDEVAVQNASVADPNGEAPGLKLLVVGQKG